MQLAYKLPKVILIWSPHPVIKTSTSYIAKSKYTFFAFRPITHGQRSLPSMILSFPVYLNLDVLDFSLDRGGQDASYQMVRSSSSDCSASGYVRDVQTDKIRGREEDLHLSVCEAQI